MIISDELGSLLLIIANRPISREIKYLGSRSNFDIRFSFELVTTSLSMELSSCYFNYSSQRTIVVNKWG